ncbi:MAG: methylated-DNA--[protein]-cysteine S-methyltransferase [Actinomycetota bacterium]
MKELKQATARLDTIWDEEADQAAERFAGAAEPAGLVDVAYAEVGSPIGDLIVASTRRGLAKVAFPNESPDIVLERLAREVSPRILRVPAKLDDVRRQLEEYFAGRLQSFSLRVDLNRLAPFQRSVLKATKTIPYGRVSTYRRVADKAGNAAAVRATGNALGANPVPIVVPCHRVLRTDGTLGGYGGGLEVKRLLLDLEEANV